MAQAARAKRAKRPTPIAERRRARKAARETCKAAQRELKTWIPAERKRVAAQIAQLQAQGVQQIGQLRTQLQALAKGERAELAKRIKAARHAAKLGECVDRTAGPVLRYFGPRRPEHTKRGAQQKMFSSAPDYHGGKPGAAYRVRGQLFTGEAQALAAVLRHLKADEGGIVVLEHYDGRGGYTDGVYYGIDAEGKELVELDPLDPHGYRHHEGRAAKHSQFGMGLRSILPSSVPPAKRPGRSLPPAPDVGLAIQEREVRGYEHQLREHARREKARGHTKSSKPPAKSKRPPAKKKSSAPPRIGPTGAPRGSKSAAADYRAMLALSDQRKAENKAARARARADSALRGELLNQAVRRGQTAIDWLEYFRNIGIGDGLTQKELDREPTAGGIDTGELARIYQPNGQSLSVGNIFRHDGFSELVERGGEVLARRNHQSHQWLRDGQPVKVEVIARAATPARSSGVPVPPPDREIGQLPRKRSSRPPPRRSSRPPAPTTRAEAEAKAAWENQSPLTEQPFRVHNYGDAGGPPRMSRGAYTLKDAYAMARETPHSAIDTFDTTGSARTKVYSPNHPVPGRSSAPPPPAPADPRPSWGHEWNPLGWRYTWRGPHELIARNGLYGEESRPHTYVHWDMATARQFRHGSYGWQLREKAGKVQLHVKPHDYWSTIGDADKLTFGELYAACVLRLTRNLKELRKLEGEYKPKRRTKATLPTTAIPSQGGRPATEWEVMGARARWSAPPRRVSSAPPAAPAKLTEMIDAEQKRNLKIIGTTLRQRDGLTDNPNIAHARISNYFRTLKPLDLWLTLDDHDLAAALALQGQKAIEAARDAVRTELKWEAQRVTPEVKAKKKADYTRLLTMNFKENAAKHGPYRVFFEADGESNLVAQRKTQAGAMGAAQSLGAKHGLKIHGWHKREHVKGWGDVHASSSNASDPHFWIGR
jgi:hypothetical protein